jgi:hypothetical protein
MIPIPLERVRQWHNEREAILRKPEDDAVLWRYFSVEKFLALITSSQLFFTGVEYFEDKFEGDYGEQAKAQIKETFGNAQYERDLNDVAFFRQHTYISCWHESEHESDAMWKLYGNGVATKSRFGKINALLTHSPTEIKHSGRVNYIDYSKDVVHVGNRYLPYFFKRKSFEHEREVRFLIQEYQDIDEDENYPQPVLGKDITIDLNSDLEELVFSPIMPAHVADALDKILSAVSLTVPTRQSTLSTKPVW